MIEVTPLSSGSKGNAILVESNNEKIMIDCGIGINTLKQKLSAVKTNITDINGVLITHEHIDHIRLLPVVADKWFIPAYIHQCTCNAIGEKLPQNVYSFATLNGFKIGSFEIHPFRTSHDASYPLGYEISDGESTFVYATDTGIVTSSILNAASRADILLIESNHDIDLLNNGPYPYYLKQRILSDLGHLSNDTCAKTVIEVLKTKRKKIILGHLSQENNRPDIAFATTFQALQIAGATQNVDYCLYVATQDGDNKKVVCFG